MNKLLLIISIVCVISFKDSLADNFILEMEANVDGEKGFVAYLPSPKNKYLLLSRYDGDLKHSVVELINLNKKEMIMPIGNIKIVSSKKLYEKNIKICLLGLNPENHSIIIRKNIRL